MKQLRNEILVGFPLILVGVGFAVWSSLQYNLIRDDGVLGPGFLPLISGVAVAVFGCVGVSTTCWQHLKDSRADKADVADQKSTDERSMITVVLVFALMAAAIFLAPIIGFFLSFALLVFVLITFVEREKVRYAVLLAVGISFVSWLIFHELLNVAMPVPFLNLIKGY